MKRLRELCWKDFCDNLEKDDPPPLQTEAEEYFFSEIASEIRDMFFEKIAEIVQLYEASSFAPDLRQVALKKTKELFKEDLPLYETLHPVLTSKNINPETANFLLICAYLKS